MFVLDYFVFIISFWIGLSPFFFNTLLFAKKCFGIKPNFIIDETTCIREQNISQTSSCLVLRIQCFINLNLSNLERWNNEYLNFQPRYFFFFFFFFREGGNCPSDTLTSSEPNTENVTARLSIKRTRVFEIRSIKVRVSHGLCARQPYTSGIDVRAYWIRWNDYIRVCMELVRKLCINGIARKTCWYTVGPLWQPDWFVGRYAK